LVLKNIKSINKFKTTSENIFESTNTFIDLFFTLGSVFNIILFFADIVGAGSLVFCGS